jgi:3-hydroxyacyl-[acyl-carrier-protein] dehydratase
MPTELSAEEIDKLRRSFKRCDEATIDAILSFRKTGDPSLVSVITRGIIARYLRSETRDFFASAAPETPLITLGVDSLTMLEIVLDVQEALDISVEDSELKQLRTVGEVNELLAEKIAQR